MTNKEVFSSGDIRETPDRLEVVVRRAEGEMGGDLARQPEVVVAVSIVRQLRGMLLPDGTPTGCADSCLERRVAPEIATQTGLPPEAPDVILRLDRPVAGMKGALRHPECHGEARLAVPGGPANGLKVNGEGCEAPAFRSDGNRLSLSGCVGDSRNAIRGGRFTGF